MVEKRQACQAWLMQLMAKYSQKPATKETLRKEAVVKWNVSRASFDRAWKAALDATRSYHWLHPLPRPKHKSDGGPAV